MGCFFRFPVLVGAVLLGVAAPALAVVGSLAPARALDVSPLRAASSAAMLAKQPTLAPVTEKTSWHLTNCSQPCLLRNALGGSGQQNLVVALRQTDPSAPEPAPVDPYLMLQGDQNGQPQIFSGCKVITFTAGKDDQPAEITVYLDGKLAPDHYTGALVFGVSSGADPVDVPVDVQVRAGPFWPIVVLLGTVAVGALLAWFFSKLLPKADFDKDAATFLTKVKSLPVSERKVLLDRWQQVRNERNTDLATAMSHLTALSLGIEALRRCRDAQDDAMRTPGFATLIAWVQRIGNATSRVILAIQAFDSPYDTQIALVEQSKREFANALQVQDSLQSLEQRALPARGTGQPYQQFEVATQQVHHALDGVSPDPDEQADDLAPLIQAAEDAFAQLEQAHGAQLLGPPGLPVAAGEGAAGALASILGWPASVGGVADQQASTPSSLAVTAARWLGPVASIVIAVTLLAIGFKTTYLDNATFGATASDWVGLAIWGLAAYGARKTLTGLSSTA
jgi:hypothetical protein